jgi:Tfp pilus assembly protein PilO
MGPRERLIASVVVAVVAIAAMWVLVVSPKRKDASNLLAQITTQQAALASAQQALAAGEQARAAYPPEVHALTVLTAAVPTSDQLPQLIHLLNHEEASHDVNYSLTGFGASSAGGFPAISLSFGFAGTYVNLQHFLGALDDLTRTDGTSLLVQGRLVTVNSVNLSSSGTSLGATVNMTTYEAPAATPLAPSAGATGTSGVTSPAGVTGVSGVTTAVGTPQ